MSESNCKRKVNKTVFCIKRLKYNINKANKEKEYLAKMLSALCKRVSSKGNCDLFYNCPAWKYGWTCGAVSYEQWLEAAKDSVKLEILK